MSKSVLVSVRLSEDLLQKLDADVQRQNSEMREFFSKDSSWVSVELNRSDVIRMILDAKYK